MNNLIQVIYISSATGAMDEESLVEILDVAREANRVNDITGMLVFNDGIFLQALEGAPDKVNNLLNNIRKDHRHTCMLEVVREEITGRRFSQWTMGFKHAHELNKPGLDPFLKLDRNIRFEKLKTPDFAQQLLG